MIIEKGEIMNFELSRFHEAQKEDYAKALKEIRNGRKLTHWMWYIFPQITGLGRSEIAQYYEIKSLEEAKSYLKDDVLGPRLFEISNSLLDLDTNDPVEIFGNIDAIKLRSSMTLFSYICNEEIFNRVLDKYFDGIKDKVTLRICEKLKKEKSL